jgi:hypothetical protein
MGKIIIGVEDPDSAFTAAVEEYGSQIQIKQRKKNVPEAELTMVGEYLLNTFFVHNLFTR